LRSPCADTSTLPPSDEGRRQIALPLSIGESLTHSPLTSRRLCAPSVTGACAEIGPVARETDGATRRLRCWPFTVTDPPDTSNGAAPAERERHAGRQRSSLPLLVISRRCEAARS
jgi:hypothetical protein